jgi:hypothetical protein
MQAVPANTAKTMAHRRGAAGVCGPSRGWHAAPRSVVMVLAGIGVLLVGAAWLSGFVERMLENRRCCHLDLPTSLRLAFAETVAPSEYASEVGQDKWVLERVFPDTERGFFVEVGSGHGYIGSNSLALERRGWTGICVDPFPTQMQGRTCETFEEVVYSETGRLLPFHLAGGLGGVGETLGGWNLTAARAPVVHKRAITLRDLLARTAVPPFIHFVSVDIEGAELEALRGFPFDRHRVGAWTIEHNREEPKRSEIRALLQRHGYRHRHSWRQDDYYVAADLPY